MSPNKEINNLKDEQKQLSSSIEENIRYIKKAFKNDDTLIVRCLENQQKPEIIGCILYLDGMVNKELIDENIIKPVIQNATLVDGKNLIEIVGLRVLTSNDVTRTRFVFEAMTQMLTGKAILIFEGYTEALVINTQGFKLRSITEPEAERVVSGPREGFTESLTDNLSMIRRKLPTLDLRFYFMKIGVKSQTNVCICYIEGIANPSIFDELIKRLSKIDIDGISSSNYIVELIRDSPFSLFNTIGDTERPDVVAAKLLEGRIAIVINGNPAALTLPFLFAEHFQTNEDYYFNFFFSSVNRLLRIVGFLITVSAPALYVAVLTFHQEMIPTPLLLSISASRHGVPLPTILEVILLLLIFEILRETGVRMPSNMGQALSIVGALVLGQASVEARIFSAPVIIVVALSGITGLMIPKLKGPVVLLRLILLIFSAFIGFYGFIFVITCILLYLCSMRSFGVPYLMDLISLDPDEMKDTALRVPLWFMERRPDFIAGRNKTRKKSHRGKPE